MGMPLIIILGFIAGLMAFSETGRRILGSCLGLLLVAGLVIGGIILLGSV